MTRLTKPYKTWLAELKQHINGVRMQTSLQVNANMLLVYWYIGKQIAQKIDTEGWGAKVIEQLAKDLQKAFPDMKGLSARNLKYMRQFAVEYSDILIGQQVAAQFTQQAVAQIPWGHHILLLDKVVSIEERKWYIEQTIKNGWSRNVLLYQVTSNLYHRQHERKKTNNFHLTLPKEQSDLAKIFRDFYNCLALNKLLGILPTKNIFRWK